MLKFKVMQKVQELIAVVASLVIILSMASLRSFTISSVHGVLHCLYALWRTAHTVNYSIFARMDNLKK